MTRLVRSLLTAVVGAGCGAGLLAAPGATATPDPTPTAPDTSFSFVSAPGDWVGGGQTETFEPSATVSVTVSGSRLHLSMTVDDSDTGEFWHADLSPGSGDRLRPGIFRGAERDPFRTGRAPGLQVGGDGRGCNRIYGSFAVNQIGFDSAGALRLADVTFVQHCETAAAPPMKGTIHFNALPLSYRQVSSPGDSIGDGQTRTYLNSTSTFYLGGTASRIAFSVSGMGDYWEGQLAAPTGTSFVRGQVYRTTRFGDDTHAGLDVFGDGRGCNTSSGTLTIHKLTIGSDGSPRRMYATFVQHCESASAPPLRGTLHYQD